MRPLLPPLLLAALCTSCFSYSPATGPVSQGARVRIHLQPPRDVRLSTLTANDVVRVEGELVRADPDTTVISAWMLLGRSGLDFVAAGETVHLPVGGVAQVEVRKVSLLRSAAVGVAALLGLALIDRAIGGGGGGGDDPPPGGGTQ